MHRLLLYILGILTVCGAQGETTSSLPFLLNRTYNPKPIWRTDWRTLIYSCPVPDPMHPGKFQPQSTAWVNYLANTSKVAEELPICRVSETLDTGDTSTQQFVKKFSLIQHFAKKFALPEEIRKKLGERQVSYGAETQVGETIYYDEEDKEGKLYYKGADMNALSRVINAYRVSNCIKRYGIESFEVARKYVCHYSPGQPYGCIC